ncbi:MAG: hypothetical protein K0R40_2722 [Burkholderiales bacterium]|jgi:hypothetical protein|nr:hypothetical protein [Burkholderiales bacterium]
MLTDKELYVETISGLADCCGGYSELARILEVDVTDLRRWAEGKGRPPCHVFFRMIAVANGEGIEEGE